MTKAGARAPLTRLRAALQRCAASARMPRTLQGCPAHSNLSVNVGAGHDSC